ncbi:MAG: hypothetical protein BWK78_01125 [Thiotrichaceae bacterium IS1]|nr:MAG: hypothetical protein BWK78_01125 [Thiotrichaceae bacterium IS1]
MLYSYAKLSNYDFGIIRFVGPGLGNLLFPWARSVIATKRHNLTPIWPTWPQLKIGTILRNEPDKRFYFGLFKSPSGYVDQWRKLYLLNLLKHVPEEQCEESLRKNENSIVIFEGMKSYFSDIIPYHQLVKEELLSVTLEQHKKGLLYNFANSISVHIRLGDFSTPNQIESLKQGRSSLRIPLVWYVQIINQLRHKLGKNLPIYVFSDGRNEELSELLSMSNVQRISFGSAIADLLALSNANILIASGSTFSMWASYLGQMPVIWYPGQLRYRLYYEYPQLELECGESEILPEVFLNSLVSKQTLWNQPLQY